MIRKTVTQGRLAAQIILGFALIGLATAAWAQSDNRYDSGLNLPFNEKAGDVNPQTGSISVGSTDLQLPGRGGLNFSFGRVWTTSQSNVYTMYSEQYTNENRLGGATVEARHHLGVGWTSNLPLIYSDSSSGQLAQFLFLDGSAYELDRDGMKVQNPQKSNLLWYDLLDKRIYQNSGIAYGDKPEFSESAYSAYGVADLSADRSKYQLIFQDNSKYWFRPDGQVMMQEDRTGLNRIWFYYSATGQLRLVIDSVGRLIRFSYDQAGNLSSVSWDVTSWKKAANGSRSQSTETRRIEYRYESLGTGGNYPKSAYLKPQVVDYHNPYALTVVTDPMGHETRYAYTEGSAHFSYDNTRSHGSNVYLLLTSIKTLSQADGSFLNQRIFNYNNTDDQETNPTIFRKSFFQGYMEYFKLVGQYAQDRHGRIMNQTRYSYYNDKQNGNSNCYSAIIELGNTRTEYQYSLGSRNKDNTLQSIGVTTQDGFVQLTEFSYNTDRTKSFERVSRQGQWVYDQKYQYDSKARPTRVEDKMGLVTVVEYDDTYGVPLKEYRSLTTGGESRTYVREWTLTNRGQVASETQFLRQNGSDKAVRTALYGYDPEGYGNVISVENALGQITHTEYDEETHALPVKIWQDVTIAAWSRGGTVESNWQANPDAEPDSQAVSRIRSWKEYNSDGSVWLEVDNEGYAVEHFYDALGNQIEQVNPNLNDDRSFAAIGTDTPRIAVPAFLPALLASRQDNPGMRLSIDYYNDLVKTTADVDKAGNTVKTTGVQKDGLGHTEAEIEYTAPGTEFARKSQSYDALGRLIAITDADAVDTGLTKTVHDTKVVLSDKTWTITYDDLGRQKAVTYPKTANGTTDRKVFGYDDLDNSVTMTDPDGRTIYTKKDWNDQVIRVENRGDGKDAPRVYTYTYDALKRKTQFVDAMGKTTGYFYDERNLLVEQRYGDGGGSDTMSYDLVGKLTRKIDPKGQILAMDYDELGRNVAVRHYASTAKEQAGILARSVRTVYDKRGNPIRISSEKLVEHYFYDSANRVIKLDRRLRDATVRAQVASVYGGNATTQAFGFAYTYNDAGMVTKMVYPDGSEHDFSYDPALSRLSGIGEGTSAASISPFISGLDYNKSGQVTQMRYANGTRQDWTFDQRKRISHIRVSGPGGIVDDLSYSVSPAGNVTQINDNSYIYDGFNQIIGADTKLPENVDSAKLVAKHFGTYQNGSAVNGVLYDPVADLNHDGRINGIDDIIASYNQIGQLYDIERFAYDPNGNRTNLTQNGDEYSYEYGPRNQLAKIWLKKKGANSKILFAEYSYDANGNTTSRIIHAVNGANTTSFEYDTFNRLISTKEIETGKQTNYTYDNAGNRLYKSSADGLTLYLRHGQIAVAMDIEVYSPESAEGKTKRGSINRYVLSGDLLAGRISTTIPLTGNATIAKSYYHLDHLNSTKAVTDETGKMEVQYVYRAFGEQLRKLGTGDSTYTYGGKELDDNTNLYYFNARYYDATTGRFINVDPIQDGSNWYVYCSNNPLNFKDPTGLGKDNVQPTVVFTDIDESKKQSAFFITSIQKDNDGQWTSELEKKELDSQNCTGSQFGPSVQVVGVRNGARLDILRPDGTTYILTSNPGETRMYTMSGVPNEKSKFDAYAGKIVNFMISKALESHPFLEKIHASDAFEILNIILEVETGKNAGEHIWDSKTASMIRYKMMKLIGPQKQKASSTGIKG